MGVSFVTVYNMAEPVAQQMRNCVCKTQTATTGTRPPLVASQYSRRNSLRISGIPETVNEDTDKAVLHVAETMGVSISPSEIDRSHRLGKPSDRQTRDVLVKFTSYRAREGLMKNRRNLKTSELRGVYVNEDFTKVRSKLLYEARKCVKANKLLGAWSSDGRILVKNKKETINVVTCEEDITSAIRQGDL